MIYLRQSTASQEVLLGPFVDATDGVTAETGLTIANTDIKIWKTGATTLSNKNSGGATHISAGNYYAVLDATDTDTIGPLQIVVQVSGALAFFKNFVVLDEAVYDAMFGTTALATATNITAAAGIAVSSIGNDVITAASIQAGAIGAAEIADGAIDAATFAAGAITASAIAADAIGASELAADAATEIATAVWASADRQLTALDEDATTIDLDGTTIGTVTTLTNLPAITANWLTAAGVAADVATELATPVLAVLGALADAASDGDPTTTDTAVSYLKQIINTLEGSAGIPTFPAAAAPANAVSLAEIIRSIYTQLGVAGAGLTAIPGPDSQTLSKHIEWISAATHGDCNITGSGPYTVEYLDILGNIVISSVSDNGERTVTRS